MGKDFFKDNIPELILPSINKNKVEIEDDWKVPTYKAIETKDADIYYRGDDGLEYPTIQTLEQANQTYWDSMMIDTSYKRPIVPEELEKAYFNSVTAAFGINDKNLGEIIITERQKKVFAYLQARYGSYLDELLQQLGYGKQGNNKGLKR